MANQPSPKDELEKTLQDLARAHAGRSATVRLIAATALYALREDDLRSMYAVITETVKINK